MALLIAARTRAELFAAAARQLDPGLDLRVAPDLGRIEDIDTALVWQPPPGCIKTLPKLGLIVSVGAGVDALLDDPSLPDLPLVRYVDPDLTGRMVEYVTLHVLYHHRRMTEFAELQSRREWKYLAEPAAHEVRVGLMGLGVMGSAAVRRSSCSAISCAAGAARRRRSRAWLAIAAMPASKPSWPIPTSWRSCCP